MYGELTAAVIRLLSGSQCSRCRGKMQVHSSRGVRVSVWRCRGDGRCMTPLYLSRNPFRRHRSREYPMCTWAVCQAKLLGGQLKTGIMEQAPGAGGLITCPAGLSASSLTICDPSRFPGPSTRPANSSSSPPFEDRGIIGPAPCLFPQGREIHSKPRGVVCYTLTNWKHSGKNSGGLGAAGCVASPPTSPGGRVFRLQVRHTSS
jgi:hypothetical protein